MRIIQTTLYKFNELSDDAQHYAHEHTTPGYDMPWHNEYCQSVQGFAKAFHVQLRSWELNPRQFKMEMSGWTERDLDLTGLDLRSYLGREYGHVLRQGKRYRTKEYAKKHVSKVLFEDTCCGLTGFCADDDLLEPIRKFMLDGWKHDRSNAEELLNDCMYSFLSAYEKELDYVASFEYYVDTAVANEWEYDEQGNMV